MYTWCFVAWMFIFFVAGADSTCGKNTNENNLINIY